MAIPSGGGATSKAAAPTSYPILSLADLGRAAAQRTPTTQTAGPPSLASTAASLANQNVAAQIAAIRAQQQADEADAAARAGLINRASTAAAGFLSPLAGLTKQDYADALAQNTGLAQGYSGQLRQDALDQANAANATLGSITGNTQHVTSQGGSLADLLYGLRGSVPGQALVTEGLGATAAARTLPAAVLATGQNQALGVIGAGRADARALDPRIAAAQGQIPGLTSKYLNDLVSQQVKIQSANDLANYRAGELALGTKRVDADVALANAKLQAQTTYQAAYLQHLQNGDSERVAHDKAMEAAGEAYHTAALGISRYNAQTARINAVKPTSSGGFTIGNTRYNADGSVLVKGKGAGGASGSLSVSGFNSALSTAAGIIQRGAQGQGGSVVQAPTGTDPTKQILDAQGHPTGFVVSPVAGVVPYQQARQNALVMMPAGANPKAWVARVQAILDANYPPGQNGRFWQGKAARAHALTGARTFFKAGTDKATALQAMVTQGLIPPKIARTALNQVYSKGYYAANKPKHPSGYDAGIAAGNRLAAATLAGA